MTTQSFLMPCGSTSKLAITFGPDAPVRARPSSETVTASIPCPLVRRKLPAALAFFHDQRSNDTRRDSLI
jgi:hypothetical protein